MTAAKDGLRVLWQPGRVMIEGPTGLCYCLEPDLARDLARTLADLADLAQRALQ